ncbi:hypothetical protein ACQVUC_04150 [Bacillus paranthracis]|uniref:hypothetical protein n=1 Tax=Bacillus paranthracis TaxID=2026186 RepID=UPI003D65FA89
METTTETRIKIAEAKKLLKKTGHSVSTREQREFYAKKKRQEEGRDDKRWFSWQDTVKHMALKREGMSDSLNDVQKGALLLMSTFLKRNANGETTDSKGGKFTVNKLSELTGKSTRQAKRIVTECENIGALVTHKEGKETVITFTEMLYKCGTLKGDNRMNHIKVYQQRVREVSEKLSLKELGLLADLLAHFHWKTHILCENPTGDTQDIKIWRRKDIIEKLRYNRKFVYDTINKFKKNRILIEISAQIDVICLSPYVVSRQAEKVTLEQIEEVAHSIADNLTSNSYL